MRIGRASGLTDTGRRRLGNEDVFVCEPPVFAVADGMGGAPAGELASHLAAAALEERAPALRGEEALAAVVREANDRVFRRAAADPAAAGMGTTITIAVVDEAARTLAIGHVGDSRAYRLRAGALAQLTSDHSLVAELVRSGRLTREEAEKHPHRAVITRSVGTDEAVEADTITLEIEEGDLYLLCSDGLTDMVSDDGIQALGVAAGGDPDAFASTLVDAANAGGGDDNITVVVFEIVAGEPTAPAVPGDATSEQEGPSAGSGADGCAATPAHVRRWGAGAGGRIPALLVLVAVAVVAALALYWGIAR
jgi:protein phosphatase